MKAKYKNINKIYEIKNISMTHTHKTNKNNNLQNSIMHVPNIATFSTKYNTQNS